MCSEVIGIHLDEPEPEVARELEALFANSQLEFKEGLYRLAERIGSNDFHQIVVNDHPSGRIPW